MEITELRSNNILLDAIITNRCRELYYAPDHEHKNGIIIAMAAMKSKRITTITVP